MGCCRGLFYSFPSFSTFCALPSHDRLRYPVAPILDASRLPLCAHFVFEPKLLVLEGFGFFLLFSFWVPIEWTKQKQDALTFSHRVLLALNNFSCFLFMTLFVQTIYLVPLSCILHCTYLYRHRFKPFWMNLSMWLGFNKSKTDRREFLAG